MFLLREPLYVNTEHLKMCQGLFKRFYWPLTTTIHIPDITLNDFRHYFATLQVDREKYLDMDIKIIDKVNFIVAELKYCR